MLISLLFLLSIMRIECQNKNSAKMAEFLLKLLSFNAESFVVKKLKHLFETPKFRMPFFVQIYTFHPHLDEKPSFMLWLSTCIG